LTKKEILEQWQTAKY